MILGAGYGHCRFSFFKIGETSNFALITIDCNYRAPLLSTRLPMDALNAADIVFTQATVLNVLAICRFTQVGPPVISFVGIDMVDLIDRIFTRHHFPDDPVSKKIDLTDTDHDVALSADRTGNLPTALWLS